MNTPKPVTRQKIKQLRQAEARRLSPPHPKTERPVKRARAGLPDQEPKGSIWRVGIYCRDRSQLTPAQERRIGHKAMHAMAVACRKASR